MENSEKILFGTDGWRGVIADNYTVENLQVVAQAIADYLKEGRTVAIGYDTRFMSDYFAQKVAEVLSSNRIKVFLSDRFIPTPVLSFTVKKRRCDLGIMITASHNPAIYNGLKIKVASGGAADLALTRKIESFLYKTRPKVSPANEIKKDNFVQDYYRFIRSYLDYSLLKDQKFKVVVDVMFGSGNTYLAEILSDAKIKFEFLRNGINPSFGGISPEPIARNLTGLIEKLKNNEFDLGIALDGDADRIAACGPRGVFIHPQKILGLIILHLYQDRKLNGGIVKTVCGTNLINNIAQKFKLPLYETPVGFKYISELMVQKDILAGGEEAGGIGVKNYIPERDGTMIGLLLLEMMAYRKKSILDILKEMEEEFGRYFYLREDLHIQKKLILDPKKFPHRLLGKKVIEVKTIDGIKLICEDESWLMLRASGTEPIVRLYSEARTLRQARELIAFAKKIIQQFL